MSAITLTEAATAEDIDAVRHLCWAYRDLLLTLSERDRQITETFYPVPKYQKLMADLPRLHAPPRGRMLLARSADGTPLGCAMTHALAPDTAEIKRLYVTEAARGHGLARRLCKDLIDHAKAAGYARILLDTSKTLTAAQQLYASLGFAPRGPYQDIPAEVLPDLLFYELRL